MCALSTGFLKNPGETLFSIWNLNWITFTTWGKLIFVSTCITGVTVMIHNTSCSPCGILNQGPHLPFFFGLVWFSWLMVVWIIIATYKGLNTSFHSESVAHAVLPDVILRCHSWWPSSPLWKMCRLQLLDGDAVVALIHKMPPLLAGTEGGSVIATTKERHNWL